jgi:hypothetical protein
MPMLSRGQWLRCGEPFPSEKTSGGVLFPLDELEKLHAQDPVTHVVLSVGGNDVRVILQAMHQLPTVVSTFHANYRAICERMMRLGSGVKIIFVLQYQVCLTHEHGGYGVYAAMSTLPGAGTGQQKLQQLMERIYAPVISMARAYKIPIIDLPRTFDPADETLYRLQIEPSREGGALIAKVITSCIVTHDFDGPSRLYSTTPVDGTLRAENNTFGIEAPWTIVREGGAPSTALAPSEIVNATLAEQRAHIEALPQAVSSLINMGFGEGSVIAALAVSGNVPQQALEVLLQDPSTVVTER